MNDNNQMFENNEKKSNKKLILIIVLAVALVAALVVGVVAIVNSIRGANDGDENDEDIFLPDYPPQETDVKSKTAQSAAKIIFFIKILPFLFCLR